MFRFACRVTSSALKRESKKVNFSEIKGGLPFKYVLGRWSRYLRKKYVFHLNALFAIYWHCRNGKSRYFSSRINKAGKILQHMQASDFTFLKSLAGRLSISLPFLSVYPPLVVGENAGGAEKTM